MPITIGILVFNGVEELDLVGPYETWAVWGSNFNGPEKVVTISQLPGVINCKNGMRIIPDYDFSNFPKLDYLLVPGGMGTRKEVDNEILIAFIQNAAKDCKAVLSVCTGAFLLQKAGLLDGKKATTHWASLNRLRVFDKTTVKEKRIVRDGNIWSSSGVSAGIDLALAFIADTAGKEVAGKVQAYMELDSHKRYGNFHKSKEAPQYLKSKKHRNSGYSFELFGNTQKIKENQSTSLEISNVKISIPRAKL